MEKDSKVDQLDPLINNRLADLNLGNSNNGSVNLTNRCSKCGSTMKRRLSSCLQNPYNQELIRNKKKVKLSPISIPLSVNSNLNSSSQSFLLSPRTVVSPSHPKTNIIFLGAISSSPANPKNISPIQPISPSPDSPFWWHSSLSPSPSPPSSVSSQFSPSFISPPPPPSPSPPSSISPQFSPSSVSPPFSPPSVTPPPIFSFSTPAKSGKELIPSPLSTQLSSPRMEGATDKPNCFLPLSCGCGSASNIKDSQLLLSPSPSVTAATENEGSMALAVTLRPGSPWRAPPVLRSLSDPMNPYSLSTTTTTVTLTPFNSNDQMNQNSAGQKTIGGGQTPPNATSVHSVVRYGNAVQEHICPGCKRRFSLVLLA